MKTHSEKNKSSKKFPKNLLVKPTQTTGVEAGKGVEVEQSITIQRPVAEVYQFWRNFENLPRIMSYLVEVRNLGNMRSHWIARTIGDVEVEWDAEIIQDVPNEIIAWRSLPDAEIGNSGSVQFFDLGAGRGCRLQVSLKYDPLGGKFAAGLGSLFGKDAESEVEKDLENFRQFMETGEIATTEGQSSARRGDLEGSYT